MTAICFLFYNFQHHLTENWLICGFIASGNATDVNKERCGLTSGHESAGIRRTRIEKFHSFVFVKSWSCDDSRFLVTMSRLVAMKPIWWIGVLLLSSLDNWWYTAITIWLPFGVNSLLLFLIRFQCFRIFFVLTLRLCESFWFCLKSTTWCRNLNFNYR